MKFWYNADDVRFHQASLSAAHIYSSAIQSYQARLRKTLGDCTGSKQWWSLLTSMTGHRSKGKSAVPCSAELADYFSSKLSHSSLLDTPPVLEDCHHSLFRQFRIKKSQVRSVLLSLDVNKSIGDDGLSPQLLKSCAHPLSGPLTSLFRKICRQSIFPASWKISHITPVFKKGSRSDPTCYRPIAVLPTLSRVFERLLAPQLRRRIDPHIPQEQFGFMRGSSASDAGVSLASIVTAAINQRAEARLVALDIKGAFDSVWWGGLLAHLWSIGFRDRTFKLFESYLSTRYIRVVTPMDSSDLRPVTAGVPQGAIWSPPLFNLYVRQLPSVVRHSLIVGYADDHSLLKIIPDKTDRIAAASDLNSDLAALYHFGQSWQIKFAPQKTFSLIISLKRDLQSLPHPPLFLDGTVIPETSSVQVLGFTFDALLTWEPHIMKILNRGKQRASQLYCCRSLLTSQDISLIFRSWIRPVLEYGNILYTGAASGHLQRLDLLQNRIQQTCCSTFQSLSHRRDAAIIGSTCRLLNGEGRGNLPDYCPRFCHVDSRRQSNRLHTWDSAAHLRFIDPCNFKTLDRFRRSWQVAAVQLWNSLPPDLLLTGATCGWRGILKQAQRQI